MTQELLTHKEQLVVDQFEKMRPGYGVIARQRILSQSSGWKQIIADMSEEEITLENLATKNPCEVSRVKS